MQAVVPEHEDVPVRHDDRGEVPARCPLRARQPGLVEGLAVDQDLAPGALDGLSPTPITRPATTGPAPAQVVPDGRWNATLSPVDGAGAPVTATKTESPARTVGAMDVVVTGYDFTVSAEATVTTHRLTG